MQIYKNQTRVGRDICGRILKHFVIHESVPLECGRRKNGSNQSKRTQRHALCRVFQAYFSKCTCLQNKRYSPSGEMVSGSYGVLWGFFKKSFKIIEIQLDPPKSSEENNKFQILESSLRKRHNGTEVYHYAYYHDQSLVLLNEIDGCFIKTHGFWAAFPAEKLRGGPRGGQLGSQPSRVGMDEDALTTRRSSSLARVG